MLWDTHNEKTNRVKQQLFVYPFSTLWPEKEAFSILYLSTN